MQTRVDKTVFERTDFGSFGWLKEGPLTPPWEVAFFEAVNASTKSFRLEERKGMPFMGSDFGSFGWIFTALAVPWEAAFFNATDALTKSFRARERASLDPTLTDFGQFGWIKEGPLTPPWGVENFAGTDAQLRNSFRSKDRARLDSRLTDFGDFAWIFKVIETAFDSALFPGIDALTKSFRSRDKTRLDPLLTDFGSFGWIKEGHLTPPYELEFFFAADALTKSFRSRDKAKLNSLLTDFGSFGWIAKVPENLSEVAVAVPDYIFVFNPITGALDKVVNNLGILKANVDTTDPTGGGGAAVGRIPIVINGVTKYIPYY